jgi:diketogulonate reductase-like aldo/keto reductase
MPKPAVEFVTQMQFIDVKGGGRAPVLGLGTARLRGRECTHAVRMALDLGYRHIDTAELYANEREIGEAIAASGVDRADLFVTTKIWTIHFRGPDARQAAETSLHNLTNGVCRPLADALSERDGASRRDAWGASGPC